MVQRYLLVTTCVAAFATVGFASAETLTIATVNNGDMIRMQHLTDDFLKANPDIANRIEMAIRQNSGLIAEKILAGEEEGDDAEEAEG